MQEKKDYIKEMEFMKEWCLTVLDFLIEKRPDFHTFTKAMKETLVNYTIKNNKEMLKGFQQGFDDLNDLTKSLSPSDYQDLNSILTNKFGKTIAFYDVKIQKKIQSILKRNKISNDEEYELIENRVSELSQLADKSQEINSLNKLLSDYYGRKQKAN